jgi:predicted nucleic acid-binding protein
VATTDAVLVDSNVLLDVVNDDSKWLEWSVATLAHAVQSSRLVINPIIYAEISIRYPTAEDVDAAFPPDRFAREPIPYEAAFLAGRTYILYRRRGGARHAPLPDFFIGAHAAVAGYRLLTRDASRFRSYFPRLPLIAP